MLGAFRTYRVGRNRRRNGLVEDAVLRGRNARREREGREHAEAAPPDQFSGLRSPVPKPLVMLWNHGLTSFSSGSVPPWVPPRAIEHVPSVFGSPPMKPLNVL